MIKLYWLFILICLIGMPCYAQYEYEENAYSLAVSGANVTSAGIYALTSNQAGLAKNYESAITVNYCNRYFLNEISNGSIGFILPIGKTTAGVSLKYFGNTELNQSRYSVALGRKLSKWLNAGILLNYNFLSVQAMDKNVSAVSGNLGLQVFPLKGVCIGTEIYNPSRSRFNSMSDADLYSGIKTGISYSDEESYKLASQLNWNNFNEYDWSLAGEYWFQKLWSLRAGIKIKESPSWSFGFGLIYKMFRLDSGFEHHTVLGLSGSVSIIYQIRKYDE